VNGLSVGDLAGRLAEVVETAGADAMNLRVHVQGVSAAEAHEQIAAIGEAVTLYRRGG
jgi:hypothetical protein